MRLKKIDYFHTLMVTHLINFPPSCGLDSIDSIRCLSWYWLWCYCSRSCGLIRVNLVHFALDCDDEVGRYASVSGDDFVALNAPNSTIEKFRFDYFLQWEFINLLVLAVDDAALRAVHHHSL